MRKIAIYAISTFALVFQCEGSAFALQAQKNEDWSVQCDSKQCQMYAEIRLKNGKLFNNIVFRKLQKNTYAGIMKLPLGIHIPSGVQIGIDSSAIIQAKLITCRDDGCEAAFNANKTVIDLFKGGYKMSVVVTKASDHKKLALNYSLMGFTRNWKNFLKRMAVLMP